MYISAAVDISSDNEEEVVDTSSDNEEEVVPRPKNRGTHDFVRTCRSLATSQVAFILVKPFSEEFHLLTKYSFVY